MCNRRPQSLPDIAIFFCFSSQIFSTKKVCCSQNIWPLIEPHCQGCHQPSLKTKDLDLASYKAFSNGGISGLDLVPRQTSNSLVFDYRKDAKQEILVGQEHPLDEEIDLFRRWIEEHNLFNCRRIYNASSNV